MQEQLKNEIIAEIKNDLTDGICTSGANISHMQHLFKSKYVSKKKMREALEKQLIYLTDIEKSKDVILTKLNK